MASADDDLGRAYPYWAGWRVVGCLVLFCTVLGSAGVFLLPVGCEKVRGGQLPIGIALLVIGLFGLPLLLLALLALAGGIRDAIRPPLLRVTITAIILPINLREYSTVEEQDEGGEPKNLNQPPAHPERIPFTAIRWARREGPPNPGSDKLVIVHDLSAQPLVIEQYMMRAGDFDELEIVLRAAVPKAFTNAPPSS